MGRESRRKLNGNAAKIIAIVATLLVISPILYIHFTLNEASGSPAFNHILTLGPRAFVNFDGGANLPDNSNSTSTYTLEIFSDVPTPIPLGDQTTHKIHGNQQSSNPYYVQLLNVTTQSSHGIFFLSPEFYTIVEGWDHLYSMKESSGLPSLTIEAMKSVETRINMPLILNSLRVCCLR